MGIESGWLLVLLFGAAIAAPVAIAVGWNLVRGPGWARLAQRLVAVVLAQVLLTLAVLALVNDANDLFPSWSDLFPQHGGTTAAVSAVDPLASGNDYVDAVGATGYVRSKDSPDAVRVVDRTEPAPFGYIHYKDAFVTDLLGERSHVRAPVYVWLPPEYFLRADAHVRFPVIELFGGYPGSATAWLRQEAVIPEYALAQERGAHPFIIVMPTMNVAGRSDLECADIPGYPAVGTFVAHDVPDAINHTFRTLRGPHAWGAMGFSEGGLCALQMATLHSHTFGAAVSLSGYGYPTSSLFGRDWRLRRAYAPDARLAAPDPPDVDLLLTVSSQDHGDYTAFLRTVAAVHPPTRVFTIITPRGGHRFSVWAPLFPPSLVWISQHLEAPTASRSCLPVGTYTGIGPLGRTVLAGCVPLVDHHRHAGHQPARTTRA